MSRRLALLDKAADELEHGKSTFNWKGEARKCVGASTYIRVSIQGVRLGGAAEQSDDDLRLARTRGRCLMCCARRVRG